MRTIVHLAAASEARPGDGAWLLLLYVGALVLIAGTPVLIDLWQSYSRAQQGALPQGKEGLARTTIALTVIVILGIAVFHVLVFGLPSADPAQQAQVVSSVLSLLGGLLAAITGFY